MKKIFVITDFNSDTLVRLLNAKSNHDYDFIGSEFDQVYQSFETKIPFHSSIIWTRPEMVIPSFNKLVNHEKIEFKTCIEEVDRYAESVIKFSTRVNNIFISSWVYDLDDQLFGLIDWKPNIGLKNLIAMMNLRIAEKFEDSNNIHILDANKWFYFVERPYSPKMWFAAKVPFSNTLFQKSAEDIFSALNAVSGMSKKLIVLDLDNTLWGGVVGENGWEGITLGGHDFKGEAYVDFQKNLKRLTLRGIQLAILSKNDESVALDAIKNHPEMHLKIDDFSGWRINWNDKAENLIDLINEINLGLDSVVFLDDNPAERERIKNAFPDVLVPDLTDDVTSYSKILNSLNCFNTISITDEDINRTQMYATQIKRNKSMEMSSSKDDWLKILNTSLKVENINKANTKRITQLFNKTNQLNLSTRRLSESEILDFAKMDNNEIITFNLTDSFGSMGLIGIVGISVKDSYGKILDFILSCRAMGRGVEKAMFLVAGAELQRMGAKKIIAEYVKTERNRPTLEVLENMNFERNSNRFILPNNLDTLHDKNINIDFNLYD